MIYSICDLPARVRAGFEGEKGFRPIRVDLSAWRERYPDGTISAAFSSPSGTVYPVSITMDGDVAVFTPGAAETSAPGLAKIMFEVRNGAEVLGRSRPMELIIERALEPGDDPPPVPDPTWYDNVIAAAAAAAQSAEDAETASEAVQNMTVAGVSGQSVSVEKQVDPETGAVKLIFTIPSGGGGGTGDHRDLTHRDDADQHPVSAVTGLQAALDDKYTLPTGGVPKADLSAAVQTSLGRADSAVQDVSGKADKVTGAVDGNLAALDDDGNLADSGSKASDFASAEDLETVEAIAKGAQQALSYASYAAMVTAFNTLPAATYKPGQNVMIITLNVPDLWISSVEQTSVPYTYVDDDTVVDALAEDGYIQVGYYRLSPLETTKVDLSDYATKEELDDKYTLPTGGVPKADLSAAVQGKLLPTADPDVDTGKVLTVDEDTGSVGWRPLPYSWGTEDLTPGVSPLATGHVYFVVE